MSEAERWLRERVLGAPPTLLEAMAAELAAAPSDEATGVPDALAAAALRLYHRVVEGRGGREDALPLLAGDALLTHAFQAQAERDPEGLAAMAARWGAGGRLAVALG